MENHTVLTFTPVNHLDARVQRLGFDLADPYVEQCWGPVIGPSATLLLRRMPTLWTERVPATITHEELARSLGLGAGTGTGSRLVHAIDGQSGSGSPPGTRKGVHSTYDSKRRGWTLTDCRVSLSGPAKHMSGSSTLTCATSPGSKTPPPRSPP